MARRADLDSVCVIGSGPIVIGQACEFDYAGCQALKVLREEGFRTIVVNSNPATIMTDPGFADATYLEPLDLEGVADVLGRVPILGICLGHQLLGLATGHETYKLTFGHRGANHPVLERRSGRVLVTSQNHGFAVAPSEEREATYVSLYDGTVEGLDYPSLGARSVQFHPEAGPGPHDAWGILDRFVEEVSYAQAA